MFQGTPPGINATDTTVGWNEPGTKLVVTGTVYKPDGTTPAPHVLLYFWQTDTNGYYAAKDGSRDPQNAHGRLRGWIQTGADGKYAIYTVRPAPYPKSDIPAHIHMLVKEPDIKNEYYIDDIVFNDDFLLTPAKKASLEKRGGNGIVFIATKGDVEYATRNIVLGRNIPDHPRRSN
jgi:protocatechuate 3,4-dioxygenase beta subunit